MKINSKKIIALFEIFLIINMSLAFSFLMNVSFASATSSGAPAPTSTSGFSSSTKIIFDKGTQSEQKIWNYNEIELKFEEGNWLNLSNAGFELVTNQNINEYGLNEGDIDINKYSYYQKDNKLYAFASDGSDIQELSNVDGVNKFVSAGTFTATPVENNLEYGSSLSKFLKAGKPGMFMDSALSSLMYAALALGAVELVSGFIGIKDGEKKLFKELLQQVLELINF